MSRTGPAGHLRGECFDVMASQRQPARHWGGTGPDVLRAGEPPQPGVQGSVQAGLQDLAERPLHFGDVRTRSGRAACLVPRAALMPLQRLLDVLDRVPADRRVRHQPGEVGDLLRTGRGSQHRVRGDRRLGPADERPDLVPCPAAPTPPE